MDITPYIRVMRKWFVLKRKSEMKKKAEVGIPHNSNLYDKSQASFQKGEF